MLDRQFIADYENDAAKVSRIIKGLTREDLLALPVPGMWSIQQVVVHLADSEQVFADRIKRVIAEDNPMLLAFDENKWSSNLHYNEQSAHDAGVMIELARMQIAQVLRALPDEAFSRSGNHSVAGPVTLAELIVKATKHLEHHLKFVADKREKLGKLMW